MGGGRLRLKGDRPKQQYSFCAHSHSRSPRVEKTNAGRPKQRGEQTEPEAKEGWADAEEVADLNGPLVLVAVDDEPLVIVCEESGTVVAQGAGQLDLAKDVSAIEPNDVAQVLLGQSLIPGQYSLKSALGKYLTSDSFGKVGATKDAVGPSEEWRPIKVEGGFSFQNVYDKFLSVDRAAVRVRADSETVGFNETFRVRCQASRRAKATKMSGEHVRADFDTIEREEAKRHVSWGGGRLKMKQLSKTELGRAEQEGRLHETLLEQRTKSKHDPYC